MLIQQCTDLIGHLATTLRTARLDTPVQLLRDVDRQPLDHRYFFCR